MNGKVGIKCNWCGSSVYRYPSQLKGKNMIFCSRRCLASYRSKEYNPEGYPKIKHEHLSVYNKEHNGERMTPEVRAKLREKKLGSGAGKSYTKLYGRHEHRVVAERMIGRKLRPGEVVHHKDGNKKNNSPENLEVVKSQAEHAKIHMQMRGGGAL